MMGFARLLRILPSTIAPFILLTHCAEQTDPQLEALPYCSPEFIFAYNQILHHDKFRHGYSSQLAEICQEFDEIFGFESRCIGRNLLTKELQHVEGYTAGEICDENAKVPPQTTAP